MGALELVLAGVLVSGVGLLLELVGIVTTAWITTDDQYGDFGLFKFCVDGDCRKIPSPSGELFATRALVIIGAIGLFGGAVMGVYFYFLQRQPRSSNSHSPTAFHAIAFLMTTFAGLIMLIGVMVFRFGASEKLNFFIGYYGYSFYLCIFGSIIGKLGGILVMRGGRLLNMMAGR